jgi:hypothetical protein
MATQRDRRAVPTPPVALSRADAVVLAAALLALKDVWDRPDFAHHDRLAAAVERLCHLVRR